MQFTDISTHTRLIRIKLKHSLLLSRARLTVIFTQKQIYPYIRFICLKLKGSPLLGIVTKPQRGRPPTAPPTQLHQDFLYQYDQYCLSILTIYSFRKSVKYSTEKGSHEDIAQKQYIKICLKIA